MGLETAFEVGQAGLQIKRIADILSASQKDVFVRLPGLVAYWPMGLRSSALAIEHSGSGHNLTQTGVCPTGYDGNSFVHLGDGTNYIWNSSGAFGISGLQTWITSSLRGLTLGGWFMVDSAPTTFGGLVSKSDDTPDRGYALIQSNDGTTTFLASGTGAAVVQVASAVHSNSVWRFVVGRFTPSSEIAIFVDGDKNTNSTAIPASLNASSQAFEVGRYFDNDAYILHGKARDVFVCAASLSDALIEEIRVTSTP